MIKTDADVNWGTRIWNPAAGKLTGWTHAIMIAGALLLLAYLWSSPKIPYNRGFGWDGVRYARWVKYLPDDLAAGQINAYYIQRTFPSLLVSIPARVFGLEVTRDYVIHGFCVANAVCVYLVALFWARVCVALRVSGSRTLVGLILLAATYPVLKQSAYSGVLTDLFALAASAAMLDCWVRDRRLSLATAVLVAMFCWASTPILGSILLLFPRDSRLSLGRFKRFAEWGPWGLATGFAGACIFFAVTMFAESREVMPVPSWPAFLPVSILISVTYVWFVARQIVSVIGEDEGPPQVSGCSRGRWVAWMLLVPGVIALQRFIAPRPFEGTLLMEQFLIGAVTRPGLFLVGDFSYYGAMVVLGALFLPALLRAAAGLGLGVLGAVAFGVAMNLYPESRMTLNIAPFFVLPLVLALPQDRLTASQWAFVGVCQLLTTKIWLPITATVADFGFDRLLLYPAQYLFMSHGPWMANDAFIVQASVAIIAVAVAWGLFRRQTSGAKN